MNALETREDEVSGFQMRMRWTILLVYITQTPASRKFDAEFVERDPGWGHATEGERRGWD